MNFGITVWKRGAMSMVLDSILNVEVTRNQYSNLGWTGRLP